MTWLASAVASVPGQVRPRVAGTTYDWDLWPLGIAAGSGPLSLELARLSRDLNAVARQVGLPLYEVTRNLAVVLRSDLGT